jgi:nucleoside-diphosphate-sugar epimerase
VFISTASAYQKPPSRYLVREDTPLVNPRWQYSRDKIACEERLMRAFRENGFPVTIVRPSLTYGLSQIPLVLGSWQHPWTMIDRMRRGASVIVPGDGTSLWTVTWNTDFATGLVGLLGRDEAVGHAFHITSDEVLTWDAIYREAARAVGTEARIVHIASDWLAARHPAFEDTLLGDKAHSVVFDNSKIKQFVPDFKCTVPWAEGVRRSLEWFQADAARRTIDDERNRVLDGLLEAYAQVEA